MNPILVLCIIAAYFVLLLIISHVTSKNANSDSFFTGNRQSPWYVVAFGMIGASLSGVTFISVPGEVGNSSFYYFQLVLGYMVGYFVIATVLLPLYYRLNLISIYGYLGQRFGFWSNKTGSIFFLISQTIGASLRLFVVATVLQIAFFSAFDIPFAVTVLVTIFLIWLYTFRGGIKTIVWTDTLQTLFMLLSVIISIYIISKHLNISFGSFLPTVFSHEYSEIFNWEWDHGRNFFKQFLAGAFIAIVMTGLDQNMMQKSLTCKNIHEAQKNIFWLSISLVFTNLLFLILGVLLYMFAADQGVELAVDASGAYLDTDDLYSKLALGNLGAVAGTVFLLGISAAAFSSADSALTSLTTSFSVDFLQLEKKDEKTINRLKTIVHIGFSVLVLLVILVFKALNNDSVINAVFTIAGYTYGPLLGLFTFGLFTKFNIRDKWVPIVCVVAPIISYFINSYSEDWWGFKFGFLVLLLNGGLTFLGLLLIKKVNLKKYEEDV